MEGSALVVADKAMYTKRDIRVTYERYWLGGAGDHSKREREI